jgi:hypothetical protein
MFFWNVRKWKPILVDAAKRPKMTSRLCRTYPQNDDVDRYRYLFVLVRNFPNKKAEPVLTLKLQVSKCLSAKTLCYSETTPKIGKATTK